MGTLKCGTFAFVTLGASTCLAGQGETAHHPPAPLLALPFAMLLVSIAILPQICGHWWEKNSNKAIIAGLFGLPMGCYLLLSDSHAVWHVAEEYFSFIVLLGALFTISGGVVIRGNLRATPAINTAYLALGAVLANIVGTTGASMLLIRPLLRTNRERKHVVHIPIFFIFVVSNIGGLLTPLGDPPLFLGFLEGVPFFWTLRLLPIWLAANGILLCLFYLFDSRRWAKETLADINRDETEQVPLRIEGKLNFLWLAGVVTAVFHPVPMREFLMICMAMGSWFCTKQQYRKENQFNFHAIQEVAILFAAIFLTMVPALQTLRFYGPEIGMERSWQFFWATGILSAMLDNAPTYLTFVSVAQGLDLQNEVLGVPHHLLLSISAGAVLMGAVSYVGNAPNFMIKCIAEQSGIKMPSFFAFGAIAALVLFPVFGFLTLCFFK